MKIIIGNLLNFVIFTFTFILVYYFVNQNLNYFEIMKYLFVSYGGYILYFLIKKLLKKLSK
jgi:Na+/melibiose symporter-like transporter